MCVFSFCCQNCSLESLHAFEEFFINSMGKIDNSRIEWLGKLVNRNSFSFIFNCGAVIVETMPQRPTGFANILKFTFIASY